MIKPATAVWTDGEACSAQKSSSTDAMEDAKYSKFEVSMLVMMVLLVLPHVWTVVQKIRRVWANLVAVGMVYVNLHWCLAEARPVC